ncbi:MAG: PD-(D/E)XK nuclease family protein [Defluviitaleaceae bacterium]|nr:PD-(D/E)XK nuclease family protein [Defluviitaleaceae bacterium]
MRFILGNPGTGKTTLCLQEIREKISTGESAPLYYLVPEQFSLQSERLLLSGADSREATTQVQVLSFNRLAFRLFSVLGGPPGKHADDLGKQMLLRKVLFEVGDELEFFKSAVDKHGFVSELTSTITEMNHYRVSVTDLTDRANDAPPALAAKLRDTALILKKYREAVTGRYLLTDEMPELLCQKLEAAADKPLHLLDGAYFWVDGFSGFTPQERQVLLHIHKRAAQVTVTLTADEKRKRLFRAPLETMEKLGKATEKITLDKTHRHAENIQIITAHDKYAAVYAAAHHVLALREKGYRFRDIAILCGDRAQYEKILQTVFDRQKIPLFVDTEIDILSHPLTELIRAALDIPIKNYSYESVFRFLKTQLTQIPPDDIDILENYVLANGIHSYKWRYEFSDEIEKSAQAQVLSALAAFKKVRATSIATVKTHAGRVFDMLHSLNVPQTLQSWFEKHMREGDPATARIHGQIWPKLCEVFDKLVEILGDEKVTHKTFAATLDAGLCQVGLGRIPPTADQIVLGDITRSRYPQIRAMLVLGANDGALPPIPTQSGLLTEYERKILKNSALELAPENHHRINEQNYNLYCAISQPSEELIFIQTETAGKPLRPAPIIAEIKRLNPNIKTTPAPIPAEYAASSTSVFFAPVVLAQSPASGLQTLYTSASRLENFARCPFAYYMNYILNARVRKLYEVLPSDLGGIFHDVIADFTRSQNFNLTREEINAAVGHLVEGLNLEDSIFHSTARNKHILNKVQNVAAASCWALCEQIKRGEYSPQLIEQEITANIALGGGKSLSLSGRVDRVDILKTPDADLIKVIDYKSGSGKFSKEEALKGVQLQLMLYMDAILKTRKNAAPGGIFYFPVDDPIINADEALDEKTREENIFKAFKMSGLEADNTFEQFSGEVNAKVKDLGTRLFGGDITAVPFTKGQKSPCRYCKFSSVCGK